jgi:hypothetical protein
MTKNPTRITYLFGAGASIGKSRDWLSDITNWNEKHRGTVNILNWLKNIKSGIPITNDLEAFRAHLSTIQNLGDHSSSSTNWIRYSQNILRIGLHRAFTSQLSPDTFGRMLLIAEKLEDYENFKNQLSGFINLIDSISFPDVRYPNLLANFINQESKVIPEEINFLTYNFDAAPEKSCYAFSTNKDRGDLDKLGVPRVQHLRQKFGIAYSKASLEHISGNQSVWLKLHGSAGDATRNEIEECLLRFGDKSEHNSGKILLPNAHEESLRVSSYPDDKWVKNAMGSVSSFYNELADNTASTIRFAWDIDEELIETARNKLEDTEILVVVGYTFPAFNQINDFKLLEALSDGDFEKIVIQLPGEEGLEVKKRVHEMFNNIGRPVGEEKVQVFSDCTSFHIPVEYFQKYEPPNIPGGMIFSK